ncbi:MAG: GGDEF and EAL domain-containing protein [Lachnospiraceae bacterium]|nr:GGDEF and EAL domain-containing protein [Lachnospiraceae bacterium]
MYFRDPLELLNKFFDAVNTPSSRRYVFVCNMETNTSRWSENAVEYFGLPGERMDDAGGIWAEHIHPDDREEYNKSIEDVFSGQTDAHLMDYRARDKNGNYVTCTCDGRIIRDSNGDAVFFVGTILNHGIADIYDPTTGLPNTYGFFEQLAKMKESQKEFTLVLFSVRDFNEVNDLYGYSFGNRVLNKFSELLMNYFTKEYTLYRLDGMRFAIISSITDLNILKNHHNKIKEMLKSSISIDGVTVPLRVAAGVVIADDFTVDSHALYTCARYALDCSKEKSHGELVFFRNDYLANNRKTLELISAIKNSISDSCRGFYLCFQPIVSAETEQLTGMEALLRWKSDSFGVVPPGTFLPWLEKDDAFMDVGKWIFRESFIQTKDIIKEHPELILNVNIAYTQLERDDYRSSLINILKETGFPPENLCIELTERCRLLDMDFLRNEIIFMKSLGIKVALDDFGTGFSSMVLLKELPVDTIKIDRGFIIDIEENMVDQRIMESITSCARDIKLKVCIEGIETAHMRDFLKKYPTTNYQGYYYSRPVVMEDFKELPLYKSLA